MANRNREVENSAARWQGNSRMWSAWNNQLLWTDFKARWYRRLYLLREYWRSLKPDYESQRAKYEHPTRLCSYRKMARPK